MITQYNFDLPKEYTSLIYLHTKLGCVGNVEQAVYIWNALNRGDSLKIKHVDPLGRITLTGRCTDSVQATQICKSLVAFGVDVQYEKTIVSFEVEI